MDPLTHLFSGLRVPSLLWPVRLWTAAGKNLPFPATLSVECKCLGHWNPCQPHNSAWAAAGSGSCRAQQHCREKNKYVCMGVYACEHVHPPLPSPPSYPSSLYPPSSSSLLPSLSPSSLLLIPLSSLLPHSSPSFCSPMPTSSMNPSSLHPYSFPSPHSLFPPSLLPPSSVRPH